MCVRDNVPFIHPVCPVKTPGMAKKTIGSRFLIQIPTLMVLSVAGSRYKALSWTGFAHSGER